VSTGNPGVRSSPSQGEALPAGQPTSPSRGEHARPPAAERLLRYGASTGRLTHVERLAARPGKAVPWPVWMPPDLAIAFARLGIWSPWAHQAAAAEHARAGRSVILATGTGSGKSVGYLAPALTAIGEGATVLYLAPTRALAADQLAVVQALSRSTGDRRREVRAAVIDSDTPRSQRSWARKYATYLLTTPDMLHYGLLPAHVQWSGFLRRLRYVIVDECHGYRGVFGSHVAHVLRRLRRVAEHHADPGAPGLSFVLASATISEPEISAQLLTGLPTHAVSEDAAPRAPMTFAMWEPPLTELRGEAGAPVRRTVVAEAADLLADLVSDGVPTLAFIRSRRGAEAVAAVAKDRLAEAGSGHLAVRVAAYRSGYLAQERRDLEHGLRSGALTALAATPALELGVNITGLDAVLIAGWPGTRAALWQQAGRAGRAGGERKRGDGHARHGDGQRSGREATAILIARDDPLDTYLVHHPQALLHRPVEASVLDPANPYILAPHLCAAAGELPLTSADLALFGPGAREAVARLATTGVLRDRGGRWHLRRTGRVPQTSLRGSGGRGIRIVEEATGRLVGTMDEPSAHMFAHSGAVYPHQGELYLVTMLDLADAVALVRPCDPGYVTAARQLTTITISSEQRHADWDSARVVFGDVVVTGQVTSFVKRSPASGQFLGEEALDLPVRTLRTRAIWWTIPPDHRHHLEAAGVDLPGAAHAAEHAAIGLLPLVAACDRWDVGGVSADLHPATGRLTVFVYDGHEGGAGFAERGFSAAARWLRATRTAIADCECATGCPSCVQSPKCGNGNSPLSKDGALALLDLALSGAPPV
jgi:DEAD/DEAH box helicase domain-containing protein